MTNVALNVNHNVAIVSIFDLKDVANQRVRRQTIAKIIPRLLEFVWVAASKLLEEVVVEGLIGTHFLF